MGGIGFKAVIRGSPRFDMLHREACLVGLSAGGPFVVPWPGQEFIYEHANDHAGAAVFGVISAAAQEPRKQIRRTEPAVREPALRQELLAHGRRMDQDARTNYLRMLAEAWDPSGGR